MTSAPVHESATAELLALVCDQVSGRSANVANYLTEETTYLLRGRRSAKAREAKDLLELFLEEDYGADWTKWQTKMDEWLKANPD